MKRLLSTLTVIALSSGLSISYAKPPSSDTTVLFDNKVKEVQNIATQSPYKISSMEETKILLSIDKFEVDVPGMLTYKIIAKGCDPIDVRIPLKAKRVNGKGVVMLEKMEKSYPCGKRNLVKVEVKEYYSEPPTYTIINSIVSQ